MIIAKGKIAGWIVVGFFNNRTYYARIENESL